MHLNRKPECISRRVELTRPNKLRAGLWTMNLGAQCTLLAVSGGGLVQVQVLSTGTDE